MSPDLWVAPCPGASLPKAKCVHNLILICGIGRKNSPRVRLATDQRPVQALTPHGANRAFRIAILHGKKSDFTGINSIPAESFIMVQTIRWLGDGRY
jgi:hypothetical protein